MFILFHEFSESRLHFSTCANSSSLSIQGVGDMKARGNLTSIELSCEVSIWINLEYSCEYSSSEGQVLQRC
jgi:hypothetical protein